MKRTRTEAYELASAALGKLLTSAAFRRAAAEFVRNGGLERALRGVPTEPPLGFSQTQWRDLVCCFLYSIYHLFKQTKLGGLLFFDGGKPFKVIEKNVSVVGRVISVDGYQNDGDYCFNIVTESDDGEEDEGDDDGEELHCEITPCNRDSLKGFIADLSAQADDINAGLAQPEVEVAGDRAFDPPHTDPTTGEHYQGGPEIHPVRGAWFVA